MTNIRHSSAQAAIVLLAGASLLLGYAAWQGFFTRILDAGTAMIWFAVVTAGGYFGALGLREIGSAFLTTPEEEPWYARHGASFFVPVAVGITSCALGLAYAIGQGTYLQSPEWTPAVAAAGIIIIWIVVLDWPDFGSLLREIAAKRRSTRQHPVLRSPARRTGQNESPAAGGNAADSDYRPYLGKRNR